MLKILQFIAKCISLAACAAAIVILIYIVLSFLVNLLDLIL